MQANEIHTAVEKGCWAMTSHGVRSRTPWLMESVAAPRASCVWRRADVTERESPADLSRSSSAEETPNRATLPRRHVPGASPRSGAPRSPTIEGKGIAAGLATSSGYSKTAGAWVQAGNREHE
jgi:hypothetical protein